MSHIVVIVALALLIVVGLVFAAKLKSRSVRTKVAGDLYYLRPAVVSPAERSFLGVLQSLDYEGVTILTKVRIADIVGVRKGLDGRDRQAALNKVSSKHVDFLLIQASDARPVAAIELDDSSHDRPDRADRDRFVDEVFRSVGLAVIHIKAAASYNPQQVHAAIDEAISKKG